MTLFVVALGWLLGIGLGSLLTLATWQWLALAALSLAAGLWVYRRFAPRAIEEL